MNSLVHKLCLFIAGAAGLPKHFTATFNLRFYDSVGMPVLGHRWAASFVGKKNHQLLWSEKADRFMDTHPSPYFTVGTTRN